MKMRKYVIFAELDSLKKLFRDNNQKSLSLQGKYRGAAHSIINAQQRKIYGKFTIKSC